MEGLIFGAVYLRREICVLKSTGLANNNNSLFSTTVDN